ncbi:MAG: LysM peptidoglycan-binding domain-containing protein [Oligoflexales bacterium]
MRVGWRHKAVALALSLGFLGIGCSDDQQNQEQEDLEVSQEEIDGEGEVTAEGEGNLFPEQQNDGLNGFEGLDNGVIQEQASLDNGFGGEGNASEAVASGAGMMVPVMAEGGYVGGPAGLPAAQGLPEMGTKLHYVVESGDTLSGIAKKIFGDMKRYPELANLTGISNPERIYPGDLIYYQLTPETVDFASNYESRTREEITVQPGDTLASIAERVYGNSEYWKNIWRENDRVQDPNNLEAGMVLYYVPAGSAVATASIQQTDDAMLSDETRRKMNVEVGSV